MKKRIYLLLLLFVFITSCQNNWIEKTEETVKRVDRNSELISEIDTIFKESFSEQIKLFKTKYESKLESNHKLDNQIDITLKFYSNDTIIFADILNSLSPKLYKKKRKDDEPIGKLLEKIRYFKNKKNGVEKLREILIYENDDIENVRIKLSEKIFESVEIGDEEYLETQMKYNRVIKAFE